MYVRCLVEIFKLISEAESLTVWYPETLVRSCSELTSGNLQEVMIYGGRAHV